MNKELEELIKQYKELKRNKIIIKDIDKDYFFKFAETVLNYIENSIPKQLVEDKIKEVNEEFKSKNTSDNLEYYIDSEICAYAEEKLKELLEGK